MGIRKYEIDMSQGPILMKVIKFAIPLMLSNLLQVFYNAADVIVVGRWAGNNALASVGATSSLFSLLVNFFAGFALGASVLVSRKYGAKDKEGLHRAVHTGMLVGLVAGVIAMTSGQIFRRPLLELMGTPAGEIIEGADLYLKIIFFGVPATMTYNFGASVMRGVGDTRRPFYILMVTGVINVLLNLLFVIKFEMGVAGVAIATTIANYLSAAAVIYFLMTSSGDYKLSIKKLRFYKAEIIDVIKIGLPAGFQSSVYAIANTVVQSGVNSFGDYAISGNAAAGNIESFIYQAMNAFYQSTVTCVSQNYGAKKRDRLKKAIYVPAICAATVGAILGLLVVTFARPLLSIYITDSAKSLDFGAIRLYITILPYFMVGIMDVLCGAIRGLGRSSNTFINSLIGACGFRIFWITCILPMNRTPEMLFLCWPLSWFVVICLHIATLLMIWKKKISKISYQE